MTQVFSLCYEKMIFIQIDKVHKIQPHTQHVWQRDTWICKQTHHTQVNDIQRQNIDK